jgi:hypothetical protein
MNMNFSVGGAEYITAKIKDAIQDGSRTAVISGKWEIDTAVRIPSNFTVVLKDCHLRLADGCYSNAFVNEHHDTEVGRTIEGTDRNISIVGIGEAIIDGGKYNGLSERNHSRDGLPPIWKNNLILFTNVDGFKISGISCHNQRWWAINLYYCRNGYVGNIEVSANDIGIDADGNEYHGLVREKYDEVLVKNADGVDLRVGCHDIVIENITGFTEDDTIALTALSGRSERGFAVEGLSSDIHHVTIRHIHSAAFCTNVRLLNQGGTSLHDIEIDDVVDMARECDKLDHGLYAVRVGDTRLYGSRHATEEETYNITIKNVVGRGDYAVSLAGRMKNLVLFGIEAYDGAKMLLDERI